MYVPSAFAVSDPGEIARLLGRIPFAALVGHGPEGLVVTHLPVICDLDRGVVLGHIARANPHPRMVGEAAALLIFQGANGYVSPSWYPSKSAHGRAVPTWNYEAVHVHGQLTWREEADWLRALLVALSERFEAGRPAPWSLDDAPADYVDRLIAAIVGFELRIERVEATRKLSQNMPAADRAGVIAGLTEAGDDALVAAMLAD